MEHHNGYIIIDPFSDHEWFEKWPKGQDMQLLLMCDCKEGQVFFFPEEWDIWTVADHLSHRGAKYSKAAKRFVRNAKRAERSVRCLRVLLGRWCLQR